MEKLTLTVTIDRDEQFARDEFSGILTRNLTHIDGYKDRRKYLSTIRERLDAMRMMVISQMDEMAQQRIDELEQTLVDGTLDLIRRKDAETIQDTRKQVFTAAEVMNLTGIKTKNTIINYFVAGTIKATQDVRSKRWTVKRNDLASYLGTDNF